MLYNIVITCRLFSGQCIFSVQFIKATIDNFDMLLGDGCIGIGRNFADELDDILLKQRK